MKHARARLGWWWRIKATDVAWRITDWLDRRFPRGMRTDCSLCPRGICSAHRPTMMESQLLFQSTVRFEDGWKAGRIDLIASIQPTAASGANTSVTTMRATS